MNKIFIVGRLGRDAEIKESNGNRFATLTLAETVKSRGTEKTNWYDVTSFNTDRLQHILPYLKKGTAVVVNGSLDTSLWTGRDGVNHIRLSVTADSIDFTGVGSASGSTQTTTVTEVEVSGDDIPMVKKSSKKAAKVTEVEVVASSSDDDALPF